jgi:hypothetical protein
MTKFYISRQTSGTTEPPTYYRLNTTPPHVRVDTTSKATIFETEEEARVAIRQLGFSGDPEISIKQVP